MLSPPVVRANWKLSPFGGPRRARQHDPRVAISSAGVFAVALALSAGCGESIVGPERGGESGGTGGGAAGQSGTGGGQMGGAGGGKGSGNGGSVGGSGAGGVSGSNVGGIGGGMAGRTGDTAGAGGSAGTGLAGAMGGGAAGAGGAPPKIITSDVMEVTIEDMGDGYWSSAPAGSECHLAAARYTLTIGPNVLRWHVCTEGDIYTYFDGQRDLQSGLFDMLYSAMLAVTPSTRTTCGYDKATRTMTVTRPSGSTVYFDSFYACRHPGDSVDGIDNVFTVAASLAQ